MCADSDCFHIIKNPRASEHYLNFLVWADGSWHLEGSTKHKEMKNRAIHIKIERYSLVKSFYGVLKYIMNQEGNNLLEAQQSHAVFDLSGVETFLKKFAPLEQA